MKKSKRKMLAWEVEHPPYIILNEKAQVYTGLLRGYPNFSDDLDEAKKLEGQAKFDTLKRYARIHLEQIFI
jgi:hypothetical protein